MTHRHSNYRWLWPLAVIATVCVASANTIEAPFMPPMPFSPDKVAHLAVFGLIATLIYRALPQHAASAPHGGESNTTVLGANATDGTIDTAPKNTHARQRLSANLCSLIAIGITALFGISDEIHQSFTPERMFDLYDFAADALGAVIAVCAYRWLPLYRKALELPLLSRRCKTNTAQSTTPPH